ncbi:hypothetical protein FDP41_006395 [Naegleria fowleri]|uniref:Uncharacterized protein n=1 Tax=Naegleria fowleri TaxID=5763 RepID=A0A6A5B7F1_NAEFO|nr:uncharacterized protein FDP41_006395 [Naegleria fowleri]KAF0974363.1 hypothetical protein FDP41_006395 [Naegleria fowleri]
MTWETSTSSGGADVSAAADEFSPSALILHSVSSMMKRMASETGESSTTASLENIGNTPPLIMVEKAVQLLWDGINITNNVTNNSTNGTLTETQPIDAFFSVSLGLTIVLGIIFSYSILRYYAKNSSLSWFLYIPLLLTYTLLFTAVGMVCFDLAAARSVDRTSAKTDANRALEITWRVIYWTCFGLAQVILPLFKGYPFTGEFTALFKLLRSIVMNLLTISVMILIGLGGLGGFLIYIAIVDDIKNVTFNMLMGLALSLSNIVGLALLITLLGYGIVILPRSLWEISNDERQLRLYEFKSVGLLETLTDTEDELIELISICTYLDKHVDQSHKQRKNVDRMMKTVNEAMENHPQLKKARLRDRFEPGKLPDIDKLSRWKLVSIHGDLINTILEFDIHQYQWKYLQIRAFVLQDIIDSKHNGLRKIDSPFLQRRFTWWQKIIEKPEWIYYKYLRPWFLKLLVLLYIPCAFILLWCEFTPLFKNVTTVRLSVLELLIESIHDRFITQFVALFILLMILVTIMVALFNVRVMQYFRIIPHHTDSYTLFYTAQLLCRVIPSMMYNFLQLIGVTKNDGVAYFNIYGELRLDGLRIFGAIGGFVVDYLPLGIILVAFVALFRILERLGTLINIERFKYNGGDKITDDRVLEGKEILQRARERKVKHLQRAREEHGSKYFSISTFFDKLDEHDSGKKGHSKKAFYGQQQQQDYDDDSNDIEISGDIKFGDKIVDDVNMEDFNAHHYQSPEMNRNSKKSSANKSYTKFEEEDEDVQEKPMSHSYKSTREEYKNKWKKSKNFESVL